MTGAKWCFYAQYVGSRMSQRDIILSNPPCSTEKETGREGHAAYRPRLSDSPVEGFLEYVGPFNIPSPETHTPPLQHTPVCTLVDLTQVVLPPGTRSHVWTHLCLSQLRVGKDAMGTRLVAVRGAVKHPIMQWTVLETENHRAQHFSCAGGENPCSKMTKLPTSLC